MYILEFVQAFRLWLIFSICKLTLNSFQQRSVKTDHNDRVFRRLTSDFTKCVVNLLNGIYYSWYNLYHLQCMLHLRFRDRKPKTCWVKMVQPFTFKITNHENSYFYIFICQWNFRSARSEVHTVNIWLCVGYISKEQWIWVYYG